MLPEQVKYSYHFELNSQYNYSNEKRHKSKSNDTTSKHNQKSGTTNTIPSTENNDIYTSTTTESCEDSVIYEKSCTKQTTINKTLRVCRDIPHADNPVSTSINTVGNTETTTGTDSTTTKTKPRTAKKIKQHVTEKSLRKHKEEKKTDKAVHKHGKVTTIHSHHSHQSPRSEPEGEASRKPNEASENQPPVYSDSWIKTATVDDKAIIDNDNFIYSNVMENKEMSPPSQGTFGNDSRRTPKSLSRIVSENDTSKKLSKKSDNTGLVDRMNINVKYSYGKDTSPRQKSGIRDIKSQVTSTNEVKQHSHRRRSSEGTALDSEIFEDAKHYTIDKKYPEPAKLGAVGKPVCNSKHLKSTTNDDTSETVAEQASHVASDIFNTANHMLEKDKKLNRKVSLSVDDDKPKKKGKISNIKSKHDENSVQISKSKKSKSDKSKKKKPKKNKEDNETSDDVKSAKNETTCDSLHSINLLDVKSGNKKNSKNKTKRSKSEKLDTSAYSGKSNTLKVSSGRSKKKTRSRSNSKSPSSRTKKSEDNSKSYDENDTSQLNDINKIDKVEDYDKRDKTEETYEGDKVCTSCHKHLKREFELPVKNKKSKKLNKKKKKLFKGKGTLKNKKSSKLSVTQKFNLRNSETLDKTGKKVNGTINKPQLETGYNGDIRPKASKEDLDRLYGHKLSKQVSSKSTGKFEEGEPKYIKRKSDLKNCKSDEKDKIGITTSQEKCNINEDMKEIEQDAGTQTCKVYEALPLDKRKQKKDSDKEDSGNKTNEGKILSKSEEEKISNEIRKSKNEDIEVVERTKSHTSHKIIENIVDNVDDNDKSKHSVVKDNLERKVCGEKKSSALNRQKSCDKSQGLQSQASQKANNRKQSLGALDKPAPLSRQKSCDKSQGLQSQASQNVDNRKQSLRALDKQASLSRQKSCDKSQGLQSQASQKVDNRKQSLGALDKPAPLNRQKSCDKSQGLQSQASQKVDNRKQSLGALDKPVPLSRQKSCDKSQGAQPKQEPGKTIDTPNKHENAGKSDRGRQSVTTTSQGNKKEGSVKLKIDSSAKKIDNRRDTKIKTSKADMSLTNCSDFSTPKSKDTKSAGISTNLLSSTNEILEALKNNFVCTVQKPGELEQTRASDTMLSSDGVKMLSL